MALHKKKVLFITTGVITLVVLAGNLTLLLEDARSGLERKSIG